MAAQQSSTRMATDGKAIIYLVHGGWHSPLFYQPLLESLQKRGYETICPLLPSCGDAKAHGFRSISSHTDGASIEEDLHRLIEIKQRDVLLIAHSYGGCPASEAAKAHFGAAVRQAEGKAGGIVGMFYISAFLTPEGENCAEWAGQYGTPKIFELHLLSGTSTAKDAQEHFFNDLSPQDADRYASLTRKQSLAAFRTQLKYAGHKYHPLTYLHCLKDQAFPIAFQRQLVQRAIEDQTPIRTMTLDSSHSPFLSMPDALADRIEETLAVNDAILAKLQAQALEVPTDAA